MGADPERALKDFVEKLAINKRIIASEMLGGADFLQKYLEFHEDLVVVKHQENLSRRAVLALSIHRQTSTLYRWKTEPPRSIIR